MKYYEEVSENILNHRNVNLENIYWYLVLGRYLNVRIADVKYAKDIYEFVTRCEMRDQDKVGFKFSPYAKQKVPDVWSTAFALVILKLLGRLKDYFLTRRHERLKEKILKFIKSCKIKGVYRHCTDNCKICKRTSNFRTLFSVFEALLILEPDFRKYKEEFAADFYLKNVKRTPKDVFRLIDMKFFDLKRDIEQPEFEFFYEFQRRNGGFSIKNKESGTINESFWIAYMFETYRYLIEYPRGNFYSFVIQNLKKIDLKEDPKNLLKLMEFGKLVVILCYVWQNLVDELEKIIFTRLGADLMLDINALTLQGGVRNAEYEVVAFINMKYNIKLNILDNETRFRQFYNRLSPAEKQFARIIFTKSRQYVRIDLKDIAKNHNKGKPKSMRIKPDFLTGLIKKMINEHFFTGEIVEKKGFFRSSYYFNREMYIPKIITCNKTVNYSDIVSEKRRLDEVKEDIYNMTQEMKQSSQNIMREVESLIFAEQIEYAEKRLKTNIKKALLDAEFFNKTVEQSITDFEYVRAEDALSEEIKAWNKVYKGLKSDFQNVNVIMSEKIRASEKLQKQKNLLKELEEKISQHTADLRISFDMFQDAIRKKLEKTYSRDNVQYVESELEKLGDKMRKYDHDVIEYSQKITVDDRKVRRKRKKIIEGWISQKQDFEAVFSYYFEGFQTWHTELANLDEFYDRYMGKINEVRERIDRFVRDGNFDEAFDIIDTGFSQIMKNMSKEASKFEKRISSLLRKRKKLYLLFVNLEQEIASKESTLEDLIKKIRDNLRTKVDMDQKRRLKEDFILLVNQKARQLNQEFQDLENRLMELIQKGELTGNDVNEILDNQLAKLDASHTKANRVVKEKLHQCERSIENFRLKTENSIKKWQKFSSNFESKIKGLEHTILDEIIKKTLSKFTHSKHSNQIDLAEVAQNLNLNKKLVRGRVEKMLGISKLSGDLLEGTCYLIIHDEEWRRNKRLHLFIDGELNDLKRLTTTMKQLYDSSLQNSTFQTNIKEFKEISAKFTVRKEKAEVSLMQKVNALRPNKNNNMFIENMDHFKKGVREQTKIVKDILTKASKSVKFAKSTKNQLESIRSIINLRMHELDEKSDEREDTIYDKNKEWLDNQFSQLENEIKRLNREFKNKMDRIWEGIHGADQIKGELLERYETNLTGIYEDYEEYKEDLNQKILNFEYQRVQDELKKVLAKKQDRLNNLLGRIQYDIENRIEINDFSSAMERVKEKFDEIEETIKETEKDLKRKNRKITKKSKVFSVKNRYLMDRWEIFREEYISVAEEKQTSLEMRVIEEYIKLVINVFHGEYVPFDHLADEFDLKHDNIEQILIRLIAEKRLPGKIYPELHIYYENEEAIKNLDEDQLEFLKASAVKRFLLKQKFYRILIDLIPIISGVLAIILYVFRLVNELPVPWWLILLIVILVGSIIFTRIYRNSIKKKRFRQRFKAPKKNNQF